MGVLSPLASLGVGPSGRRAPRRGPRHDRWLGGAPGSTFAQATVKVFITGPRLPPRSGSMAGEPFLTALMKHTPAQINGFRGENFRVLNATGMLFVQNRV